jgi:hypothetical protein
MPNEPVLRDGEGDERRLALQPLLDKREEYLVAFKGAYGLAAR